MESQTARDLFDHVADGLFVCDPDTCVVQDVNQSALAMIEYEREELLGERIDAVSEPIDSGESWSGAIAQAREDDAYRFELRLLPGGGGTRPAEAHLTVTGIDGTDRAIVSVRPTGRRGGRGELRVTEQMRQILDLLPDPLFVKNGDGEFLLVNEAFADAYGMTPDEIEGKSEFDIAPDRAEQYLEKDRELIEEGRSELVYEDEFYADDGSKRYHQTIKIPVELPDVDSQAIIGYVRDVTELKNYEAALEQQYERLHALFANSQAAVVEYVYRDGEPVVETVNDRFQEWFGYGEEAAAGQPVDDLIVPPAEREEAMELNEKVRRGEHLQAEVQRQTVDGVRTFIVRNAPIDTEDEIRGYASYTDITERKEREQALEETKQKLEQSNEKLAEFASAVSHDLRNPLNVAESWLELAREEHDSESLRKVARAHDRMEALIEDVLTLAREGTAVQEPEWVALDDVVDACWSTVDTADATLVSRTDRRIRADRDRLQRLLENLFRNAVEHGGTGVTVRIGTLDGGFYVADDGPGIPEAEREQVFERGYSTSSDGTGFGLAIVAEVADAHGWSVAVTESEDGGARFEVTGVDVA